MTGTHVEREDKYDVDAAFRMPPALVEQDGGTVRLESTYFDTAERDLLRHRMTLRRRRGDTDTGWQLKVPHGSARLEVHLPEEAGDGDVPAQLAELVRGASLAAPLHRTAVLRTERRRWLVRDGERTLAEIADDTVHAAVAGESAGLSEWREIEVELVDGDERTLRRIGKKLQRAGAVPSASRSKLGRALDAAARPQPEAGDASQVMSAYLSEQYAALVAGDVSLRRGLDGVHKTRVAARRMRSVLRVFGKAFDDPDVASLDAELSWYQDLLGAVRDAQVQRQRLADLVAQLPAELVLGPVAADIESDLVAARVTALADVREALDSDRYLALMRSLRAWADEPPLRPRTTTKTLRRLAHKAQRKTARRLERGVQHGGADLHRARKAAKRSRYAAELVRPAVGGSAKRSIQQHKRLQDVLGDYQDSVVSSGHLRRLGAAGAAAGRNGFTFGLLYARELQTQRGLLAKAATFAR